MCKVADCDRLGKPSDNVLGSPNRQHTRSPLEEGFDLGGTNRLAQTDFGRSKNQKSWAPKQGIRRCPTGRIPVDSPLNRRQNRRTANLLHIFENFFPPDCLTAKKANPSRKYLPCSRKRPPISARTITPLTAPTRHALPPRPQSQSECPEPRLQSNRRL